MAPTKFMAPRKRDWTVCDRVDVDRLESLILPAGMFFNERPGWFIFRASFSVEKFRKELVQFDATIISRKMLWNALRCLTTGSSFVGHLAIVRIVVRTACFPRETTHAVIDVLDWIADDLRQLSLQGLLRQQREVVPLTDGRCRVDGVDVWDCASNDYLDLARDSRVAAAAAAAIASHGVGATASPLVCGRTDLHRQLEQALARFEGAEAAIVFPTGMAANVGTVSALACRDDVVFCDRLNHASLVDGCRLSGAKLRVYHHSELTRLDEWLAKENARRKFIVTDSVFSMDGDLAPLPELCEIAERHSAALIVDEAHGTGVFGEHGRGVAELLGVEDRIAVRIGTLSKAVGTLGGFVTGPQSLIDYLWNKARTQIYSTALPPAVCVAAATAIQIIATEPDRRVRLQQNAAYFRQRLNAAGVTTYPGSAGPIVPIVLQDPLAAMTVAGQLFEDGFLVGAIRPPTVPRGTSRLRITLRSSLPTELLEEFAIAVAKRVHAVSKPEKLT